MRWDLGFGAAVLALTWAIPMARAETPEGPAPSAAGIPFVHLDARDRHAILFKVPSPEERARLSPRYRWRGVPICWMPCDQVVDGHDGRAFFVGRPSDADHDTERFRLDEARGRVVVRVHRAHYYGPGIALTAAGGAVALGGLVTMVASYFTYLDGGRFDAGQNQRANQMLWAGQAFAGLGLATLIAGAVLAASGNPRVEIIPERSPPVEAAVLPSGLVLRF